MNGSPGRAWPALLLGIVVVEAATLAAHWPALSAEALCFDDIEYINTNQLIPNPSWGSAATIFREVTRPSVIGGYYHPLAMTSLMLDMAVGGTATHVRPFRITSLGLHMANAALIVLLIYLLFRPSDVNSAEPRQLHRTVFAAALAGLLFGVHPVSVEPVVWLAERKAVLATFFALASLCAFVLYARRGGRGAYAAALLLYALGLLSKPTTTPLPAILLLLDFWPLGRLSWRTVLEKAPFFILGFISGLITIISQGQTAAVEFAPEGSALTAAIEAAYRVTLHLKNLFWPVNLSPYYSGPNPASLANPAVLVGIVALVLLAAAVVAALRWSRGPVTALLIFVLALAPTLGALRYTKMFTFTNYSYLPAFGLLILLAAGLLHLVISRTGPHSRRLLPLAALGLLLAASESLATRQYLRHWCDTVALGRHMVERTPNAATPHRFLADELMRKGETQEALVHYRRAVALDPENYEAQNNLGVLLSDLGQYAEAEQQYEEALRVRPGYADALVNRGIARARQNRFVEAARDFEAAVTSDPQNALAQYNHGATLEVQGRRAEAMQRYSDAVRLNPRYTKARLRLARLLESDNQLTAAVEHYEAALRIEPDNPETRNNFACTLARLGRKSEALAQFQEALRLRPDYPEARENLQTLSREP